MAKYKTMEDIINIISKTHLFRDLPPDLIRKISAQAHPNMHKKGKILFIHGDTAEHYYIVKSGHVKLFRETLEGTQAVIDVLSEGDVFG